VATQSLIHLAPDSSVDNTTFLVIKRCTGEPKRNITGNSPDSAPARLAIWFQTTMILKHIVKLAPAHWLAEMWC
jgi:hypothetical protein